MAQSPFEIVAGPADVFIAATGTAFPLANAVVGAGWTALGQTEGGVNVQHTQNIEDLGTDQKTVPVKGIRTEEGLEIGFDLAELTLENYAKAMNNATVTSLVGPPVVKEMKFYRGVDVARHAFLVRGPSPYGNFKQQWQVPVVSQVEEPELQFVKDDKAVLTCSFRAYADLSAATDADLLGKLIAQTA